MSKEKRFELKYSQGLLPNFQIIVDTETGVNYLYMNDCGITVLVDENGKPIVTKNKNK